MRCTGPQCPFKEFALADDNVETSQQVSDGDIVTNVLHEVKPEAEQVDSDDDNESTEADDGDYIGSTSQFLHIVTHQRAFVQ